MPDANRVKRTGRIMAEHVLAFLPACREARGPVSQDIAEQLVVSRLAPNVTEEERRNVISDVFNGSTTAAQRHKTLVTVARYLLCYTGVITISWLKRHPSRALVAVHDMMQMVEAAARNDQEKQPRKRRRTPKRFPLLPIFGQRRQMICLDGDTLLAICKATGLLCSAATRGALTLDFKRSLFRVSSGFNFSDNTSIESDGVAVILRVFKEKTLAGPKVATVDDLPDLAFSRVLAGDEGRRQIVTLVEWAHGERTNKSVRLTRKEYYAEAGVDKRMSERRRRDQAIAAELLVYKKYSIKTADVDEFEEASRKRARVIETIWRHKLGRWTSIADMSGYIARRRALDRFWRHKAGLEACHTASDTIVVFGDGRFSCTGKKERAVPRRALEAAAARFAKLVVKVNEAYTTCVCSKCHMPNRPVKMLRWRMRNGTLVQRRVDVLELRRCVSNVCSASPYKSRDVDAAISILDIFFAGNARPICYTKVGYETALAAQAV